MNCKHKHQTEIHKRMTIKGDGYTISTVTCTDCRAQLSKKVEASV